MLKSCAAKRTPKDVFITTWPKVVWNGAQGLGSRLLKLRTYHQPTAGHRMPARLNLPPVSWTGSVRESHPLVT